LIDRHGTALRVLDAHQFKDYGGVHEFYGQVETLQAFEGAGVVEKVLQSPGQNKVLVVDGGGNLNSAIFGKTAATSAKQNGWRGVIVNGAIREAKHVAETSIGCKALGANPNRGKATTGSKGTALTIGGMQIASGMWIYADKVRRENVKSSCRYYSLPVSQFFSFIRMVLL
jgi:regulator of ribonuclease activity A